MGSEYKIILDKLRKQVSEHYNLLKSQVNSDSITTQRLNQLIFEFSQEPVLITPLNKMWGVFQKLNYKDEELIKNKEMQPMIPLHRDIYAIGFSLIERAMGTESMISGMSYRPAHRDPSFLNEYVFFDRFRFDICLLVSKLIEL